MIRSSLALVVCGWLVCGSVSCTFTIRECDPEGECSGVSLSPPAGSGGGPSVGSGGGPSVGSGGAGDAGGSGGSISGGGGAASSTVFTVGLAPAEGGGLAVDEAGSTYALVNGGPLTFAGGEHAGLLLLKILSDGTQAWALDVEGADVLPPPSDVLTVAPSGDVFFVQTLMDGTLGATVGDQVVFGENPFALLVVRVSTNGDVLATKVFSGGPASQWGDGGVSGIAALPSGDVVITGSFPWADSLHFDQTVLVPSDHRAGFLVRLSPNLDVVWAEALENFRPALVEPAPNADLIVAGEGINTVHCGGLLVPTTGDELTTGDDIVLCRLNGDGDGVWAKTFGGTTGQELVDGIFAATDGTIHLAAWLVSGASADFGGGPIGSYPGMGLVATTVLVALDEMGGHLYSKGFRFNAGSLRFSSVWPRMGGGVWVGGTMRGTLNLPQGDVSTVAEWDGVVMAFDASGAPQEVRHYGVTGNTYVRRVVTAPDGSPTLLATVNVGSVDFGNGPVVSPPGKLAVAIARLPP